jgi:hypothetical protein
MVPFVPEWPWWLIIVLAFLIARSLEGLLCQLGVYLRPRITEVLQTIGAAIVERWDRGPANGVELADSQRAGVGESQSGAGGSPRKDRATPGLSILQDAVSSCREGVDDRL